MRSPACTLALALTALASLALPVAGQDAPPASLLQDDAGDVQAYINDTPAGDPGGRYQTLDLEALTVAEAPNDFQVQVQVASLNPDPEAPLAEYALYMVDFRVNGMPYRVEMVRSYLDAPRYFASLQRDDGGRDYSYLRQLDVMPDEATNTLTATVLRDDLLDPSGASPFPGMLVDGWTVRSQSLSDNLQFRFGPAGQLGSPLSIRDAMPDEGEGPALPIVYGVAQSGDGRLHSDTPVRASNGEATTFIFRVDASNVGEVPHRFRLQAADVPSAWSVGLPVPMLDLAPGENATVPILVTTPFAHEHGTFQDLTLEMQSTSDPSSVGRIRLGVRYLEIAQPAGHHDKVWFHSRTWGDDQLNQVLPLALGFPSGVVTMNAMQKDPNDQAIPIEGDYWGINFENNTPTQTYAWDIELSPGLQMGLDFDLAGRGALSVPVHTTLPIQGAVLSGELVHYGKPYLEDPDDNPFFAERNRTVLATFASAAQDLGAQSDAIFDAEIVPAEESDLVTFEDGAGLTLEMRLEGLTADNVFFGPRVAPTMLPGGEMRLPLLEYHDPVDGALSTQALLSLTVEGAQDRRVNAGETAVFNVTLSNMGPRTTVQLDLAGGNEAWATIVGPLRVTLGEGEDHRLAVAVAIPAGTTDGEVADLVLQAASVDALDDLALVHLWATVDSTADHPDESGLANTLVEEAQNKGKGSPVGFPVALAAIAAAALAMRRRSGL